MGGTTTVMHDCHLRKPSQLPYAVDAQGVVITTVRSCHILMAFLLMHGYARVSPSDPHDCHDVIMHTHVCLATLLAFDI